MQNKMIKFYIGGVAIAIVFFLIGMQVGKSGKTSDNPGTAFGNRNFGNGQMMNNQNGSRTGMRGNGATMGTVISSDDKSVTISLRDGGSKTIYISDTTSVLKSTSGKKSDLANGTNVIVNGTANQDGSIAASSIQIRPADQNPPEAKQ